MFCVSATPQVPTNQALQHAAQTRWEVKNHCIYKNQLFSSTPITIGVYETSLKKHCENLRHTTSGNVG